MNVAPEAVTHDSKQRAVLRYIKPVDMASMSSGMTAMWRDVINDSKQGLNSSDTKLIYMISM